MLFRWTGQVVFTTSPQEHYFDCPYQLSSEIIGQTYRDAMVNFQRYAIILSPTPSFIVFFLKPS